MKKLKRIRRTIFCSLLLLMAVDSLNQYQTGGAAAQNGGAQLIEQANAKKGEFHLLGKSEIERAFRELPKTPPTNQKIVDEDFYNVAVARVEKRNGPPELHLQSDRVFFIKKGKAVMRIGGTITDPKEVSPNEIRSTGGNGYSGYQEVTIRAGDVLSIPKNVAYQIVAEKTDVSFTVVRIN